MEALCPYVTGVNKVQLLGRVGNFPKEFTSPTTGKKLVVFALATSTNFKTKDAEGVGSLVSLYVPLYCDSSEFSPTLNLQ